MSDIRISVAVASYNGEKYIKEQLDSILCNLSAGDEIVVSDDGSSDKTLEILQTYQNDICPKKQVAMTIVHGPKMGIKQNIGTAMQVCKGKYIFLADQDDVWTENKVETVMQYLGQEGCHLVNHDARVMNGDLTEEIMPSFFDYRGSASGFFKNFVKNRFMGCCMAFESTLLSDVLPIPEQVEMHDQWIGLFCELAGGKTVFLREQLLLYRRHDNNVSDFSHGTVLQMIKKRLKLALVLYRRFHCIDKRKLSV